MTTIWVLGEERDGTVRNTTHELITAARGLADDASVTVIMLGQGIGDAAAAVAAHGADQVLVVDDPQLSAFSPDGWADVIARLASDAAPAVILGSSSARGRDLTPRVAAALGVSMASDVIEMTLAEGGLEAVRPIYAGKALMRVQVADSPRVATVRPNSYPAAESGGSGTVQAAELGDYAARAVVTAVEVADSARPDVAEADMIVAGGRGMGGPEHFAMLEDLADTIGAAVGASRAVVDAGWRPHSEQVGQTGKTVAPTLYFAFGISGAVQHVAGMKTSKCIVAVNKDAEAPIFSMADYGIVGDVFDVLPEITKAVREIQGG